MAPEFPEGCIIVVEPGAAVEDGCFVVARTDGDWVFRQLRIRPDCWRLHALDSTVDEIVISGPAAIHGRVVQRAGRTRKDRKHYL